MYTITIILKSGIVVKEYTKNYVEMSKTVDELTQKYNKRIQELSVIGSDDTETV